MGIFGTSTRDLAVRTAASLESHVEECGRNYQASKEALSKLSSDLESKHKENISRFEASDRKIYIIGFVIILSVVLKGTPLDVIAKLIGAL